MKNPGPDFPATPSVIRPVRAIFCGVALGLLATAAMAQGEVLMEEVRLSYGEKRLSEITVPPGQAGESVYLVVDARIDAGKNYRSGGTDALRVRVNGMPVTVERLVNKPHQWIYGSRRFVSWAGANDTLKALYYPWDQADPKLGRDHRYVLDITSLLRDGKARVELEATFAGIEKAQLEVKRVAVQVGGEVKRNPFPVVEEPLYLSEPLMEYRQRAITYHRGVEIALETAPEEMAPKVSVDLSPPASAVSVPAELEESGAIRLGLEALPLSVTLKVGLPGGGWQQVGAGSAGWKVARGEAGVLVFTTERLRIERRLEPSALGVSIVDRVTNLTQEDLPLGLLYEYDLGTVEALREFRLFGRKRATFHANTTPDRESATVPTVWLRTAKGAFGLLMEDDRLRNLTSYMTWDHTLAIGSDMTYLQPGQSHELRWAVSPGDADDYYGFLNRIRAYWKTYQEIPGLFGFIYPAGRDRSLKTPEAVAQFLKNTGITNPCLPPALNPERKAEVGGRLLYVYGQESPDDIREAIAPMEAFIRLAREGGVTSPFALYTDMHLVSVGKDRSILDQLAPTLIHDYRGNPVEYRERWLYNLLPLRDNVAGEQFMGTLKLYLDTPGVGGIFLDEWDHSRARYAFNFEDGVTALLDEGFKIRRKIGLVPFMVKEYQAEVVARLRERGAVIYANQFDSTRLALDLPVVHFAEPTQYDSYLLCGAQMGRTPLSLTAKRSSDPWLDVQEFLKHGVLTCFYAQRLEGDHLLKEVYPITARKLGPGYVVGGDRIVTLRSGRYSFGGSAPLEAHVFGGKDGQRLRSVRAEASPDGSTVLELALDRDNQEIAIIKAAAPVTEP